MIVQGLEDVHFQYVGAGQSGLGVSIQGVFREVGNAAPVGEVQGVGTIDKPGIGNNVEGRVAGAIVIGNGAGDGSAGRRRIATGADAQGKRLPRFLLRVADQLHVDIALQGPRRDSDAPGGIEVVLPGGSGVGTGLVADLDIAALRLCQGHPKAQGIHLPRGPLGSRRRHHGERGRGCLGAVGTIRAGL